LKYVARFDSEKIWNAGTVPVMDEYLQGRIRPDDAVVKLGWSETNFLRSLGHIFGLCRQGYQGFSIKPEDANGKAQGEGPEKELVDYLADIYDTENPVVTRGSNPELDKLWGLIERYGSARFEEGSKHGYDAALVNLGHRTLE